MKALVLIGGFGTRLRPVTYTVPKQLIPLAGQPMLYHVLDMLPPEVDHAVLATGYLSESIARAVRDRPPKVGVTTVKEAEPLGTGGGMRNAGGSMTDPFLLLNSDVISGIDVRDLLVEHRRRAAFGTMYLSEVDDPRPYGVAALREDGRIERFVEKPPIEEAPSRWINAGIAVWAREVLERIPPGRPLSFEREIVPTVLDRGVYGYCSPAFWEDAGSPERLLHAQRLLFDAGRGVPGSVPAGTIVRGAVAVDATATAEGAELGPYVTVGPNVTVGREARLDDAIVMDGARIGRGATVHSSLVGPGVRVPDGAKVTGQVLGATAPG